MFATKKVLANVLAKIPNNVLGTYRLFMNNYSTINNLVNIERSFYSVEPLKKYSLVVIGFEKNDFFSYYSCEGSSSKGQFRSRF